MDSIVLITGGTGAIGQALCREFHSSGHRVVANCHAGDEERSRDALRSLASEGVEVALEVFDVGDAVAAATAIGRIERDHGPIEVLVNAAGITRDATLAKLELDDWNAVMRTNLDSVYHVTRPCIGSMVERGYGRIVNISSVNGQRGQFGQTNYSAAKAGITGFTKALAREVARKGITVNAVSPGYVRSPMIEKVPEKVRTALLAEIPVGRFAEPSEIARAVAFLADRASGYLTGVDLSVNGGFHMG